MRTKKSAKNILFALLSNIIVIVIGLISQAYFLKTLGSEFLGLNSLFTNIISMLSIAELGIGSAIVFHLYKPLYNDDKENIKSLMNFYKKTYRAIAIIVFCIGILIVPFLSVFVNVKTIDINYYFVFILFLSDACLSYLLSYKRSILYADQKNYIINIIHITVVIIMNVLQILFLVYTSNYYIYLEIKILFRFVENIIINCYVNYKYSYLKDKDILPLNKNILMDIKKKVKALFVHQIGAFCVNGTDNLIISKFLGLTVVGLYSNYFLIINSISNLFSQSFSAITSSIGNLLVSKEKNKSLEVFQQLNFINFWLSCFTMICLFVLTNDFICLWIGEDYLLSNYVLLVLCINYFLQTMKRSITVFKEAGGIFYEDRFVPFLESGTNLIISIILVRYMGLIGVFIGTLFSVCILHFYSYPKYVYSNLLNGEKKDYIFLIIKRFFCSIIILLITYFIASYFNPISNLIIRIVIKLILCFIVPNIMIIFFSHKSRDFVNTMHSIKTIFKRSEQNDI